MAKLHAGSARLALALSLFLTGCGDPTAVGATEQADPAGAEPMPAGEKAAQKAGPIPSGDVGETPVPAPPPEGETDVPLEGEAVPPEDAPSEGARPDDVPVDALPPDGAPPPDGEIPPDGETPPDDETLDPPEDVIPPDVDTPPDVEPEDVETDMPPPQAG